jgi:hypothetical protein
MQAEEHPQSGIAGLRHWRYDVDAGLQVELVSLLLSPGITVASGAPLITGKKDFIGTKSCGTSQSATYLIEMSCLN